LFLREGLDKANQIEMVQQINSHAQAIFQAGNPSREAASVEIRGDLPDRQQHVECPC
jgi:hypothetical protein